MKKKQRLLSREKSANRIKQIWIATAVVIAVALLLGIISNLTSTGVKETAKETRKKEKREVEIYTGPANSNSEFETVPADTVQQEEP